MINEDKIKCKRNIWYKFNINYINYSFLIYFILNLIFIQNILEVIKTIYLEAVFNKDIVIASFFLSENYF